MGASPAGLPTLILGLLAGSATTRGQEGSEGSLLGLNFTQISAPIPPEGGPTIVQIGVLIEDVQIEEDAQVIQVDLYLRTLWEDHRINLPGNVTEMQLHTSVLEKMWVPDLFFLNIQSISRPKLLSDASGIKIYRNKTVAHSGLYLTRHKCYLSYERYPMDRQKCTVRLQTYMYKDDVLLVKWHHSGISWDPKTRLKSFDLQDIRTIDTAYDEGFTGRHSEIKFEILLVRKVRNSVLSVFVPSTMLIFVSWLSLWVPPELVPGRMVLVITTLLTLTGLFNANVQSIPEVSYVKALDVWILTCIVFVFFTIVEYIIVLRLSHSGTKRKVAPEKSDKGAWSEKNETLSGAEKAAMLETVSRAISPVAFFVFNLVYWSHFLADDIE